MKKLRTILMTLAASLALAASVLAADVVVYENTFESASDMNRTIPVVSAGVGSANSSVPWHWGTSASFSLETPAGQSSQMMKITPAAGASQASMAYINAVIDKPGLYTLDFDYYCPTSTVTDGRVLRYGFSEKATEAYFVKGALTHASYSYTLPEGMSLTAVVFMMRYGSGYSANDVFYVDNIRLLYKAPAEPLETDPTLGEVIVSEDFESASDGKVIFNSTDYGGTLTPYANSYVATPNLSATFADRQFCFTRGGSLNTSYVSVYAGNTAIRVDQPNNGSSATPHIGLNGGNSNAVSRFDISRAGTYTIKADFIIPAACVSKVKQIYYQIFVGDDVVTHSLPLDTTRSGDQTYTLQKSVTLDGNADLGYVRFIAQMSSANAGGYFFVDNVQLYYMGNQASVNVGDKTVKSVFFAAGSTLSLPYAYELYDETDAFHTVSGFKLRETGEMYPCGSQIVTTASQTSLTFDAVFESVAFTVAYDLGNAPGLIPEYTVTDGDTITLPASPNAFTLRGWRVPWSDELLDAGTSFTFDAETMGKYAVHGRRVTASAVWADAIVPNTPSLPALEESIAPIPLAETAAFAAAVYEAYFGTEADATALVASSGIAFNAARDTTWADAAALLAVTTPQSARRALTLICDDPDPAVEELKRAGILASDTASTGIVSMSDILPVLEKLLIKSKRVLDDADKQTVFIVGDSLCAGTGAGTHTGWVRKLDNYLDGNLNIVNAAVGGYNTTSYYKENPDKYFDAVKQIRYGDYLFIALGTNDSTLWNDGSMTATESRDAFYRMAREVMMMGGTPVMICPVGRNQTESGVYTESDPKIIDCMRSVNSAYGLAIPIVNFKELSLTRLGAMSESERNAIYYDKWIHYSDYGADYVCGLFEELLGMSEDINLFMLRDHFTFTHIAEQMPAVAPGVNALTGSVLPWTFEDDFASVPVTVADASVVNNPKTDSINGSKSVMRFSLDAWKAWVYAFKEPLENDRPVFVGFDYCKTADDMGAVLANLYICKNGVSYIAANLSSFTASGAWRHYGAFPAFDGAYSASDSSVKNTDPLVSINMQHGGAAGTGHTYAYYDNITVIPSYKLTYMANDGTGREVAHTYFLADGDGDILTSYSPDLSVTPTDEYFGYTFRGWSLSKDASKPDAPASIPLNHRDITLYAVWEKDAESPDAVKLVYDFETASTRTFTGGTYTDGVMTVENTASQTGIDTDARALRYFVIRLCGNASSVTLSFTTQDDTTFSGVKSFTAAVPAADGRYQTVVIETNRTNNAAWTGIIKDIRVSVDAASVIEDIALYTDYTPESYDGSKAALYASSESITADSGSVTLSPYFRNAGGTVVRTASYETDSLCAVLEKNADGSAKLIGRMNGDVTVTAHFAGTDKTASVTVTVSGQSERAASNAFKVICFGNSIRSHSPNESLGWSGSWGMAASSAERDYAHRFIYYLNKKFGDITAALYEGYWMAGIEGVWKQYEDDPTHDFTADMAGHIAAVEAVKPDIITVQCGENAGMSNAAAYENALTQFVKAMQNAAPDAIIVICTPFWGGDAMIEGAFAAAEATGVSVARLDTLNTLENKATGLYENGAVANHPGDTGMDNIAKLLFEQVNITLTESPRTVYTARPVSVTVTASSNTVTADGGTLTLTASVLPSDAAQDVTWSVDDTSVASVTENGLLTALDNGTVTVTAVSKQDADVYGTYTVIISGQTAPFTLSFTSGLTGTVLPDAVKAKGTVSLAGYTAACDGCRFIGWSKDAHGTILDEITLDGDTTLTARFEKAAHFDFARDGFDEGFDVENGFNRYISDGVYLMLATDTDTVSGEVLTIRSPKLSLDASDFDVLNIRMSSSAFGNSTELSLTIHSTDGDTTFTKAVTTTDMTTYSFDLSSVTGTVTGFTLVPTDVDCAVRLDDIAFEKAGEGDILTGSDGSVFVRFTPDAAGNVFIALFDADGRLTDTVIRRSNGTDAVYAVTESESDIASAHCFVLDECGRPLCADTVIGK